MTSCPNERQLDDFVAGTLSPAETDSIEMHLRACESCGEWMRGERDEEEVLVAVRQALARPEPIAEEDRMTESPWQQTGELAGYRILGRLGEGGMGIVFEAEQQNPRRRVALKIVRPEQTSERMLRRLEHEAQILARLQHPGIARIHEAGVFDSAGGPQPFFAMELVRGEPLLAHAAELDLATPARLRLLIKVCHAVHHAHQKGIIHRDLKPSNIVVDGHGQPVVLDFGVARLRDEAVEDGALATRVGQVVGTVPYMSPEQLGGVPDGVDVRSDVYALGVIGYQLLTGRLPIDLAGKSLTDAIRAVENARPTPLRAVDPRFAGDLDTIFATALAVDRAERYQSASDLGADLERYLTSQPVAARPPSTLYQLRLFARRNKVLVGATLGIALTVLVAAAVTTREMLEARKALARTQAINDYFLGLLSFGSAYRGSTGPDLTVREAMKRSEAMLADLHDQPDIEASVRLMIGDAHASLHLYDEARRHYVQALELFERHLGELHPQTTTTLNQLALAEASAGETDRAEQLFGALLDRLRRSAGARSLAAGQALVNLGTLSVERGQLPQARETLEAAVDVLRAHEDAANILAAALSHLALVRWHLEAPDAAEELYRESLDIFARVGEERSAHAAHTRTALANLLVWLERPDEAAPLFVQALRDARAVLGDEHPGTEVIRAEAVAFYRQQGLPEKAAELERARPK